MDNKKAWMEKLAHDAYVRGGFNGAWLYAEGGKIVSKGVLGYRDPANKEPLTEDTIFQLASVSKQFTATAVMLCVRKGLLHLEDKLSAFFPELTAYRDVTIRQLLSHTGGVPDYFDDEDWFLNIKKEENRVPGNDEIVRFLCETKLEPCFAPGEDLEYSNTGYNLLALLVERLSGMPYEDFLRQNVFEPAGMKSTHACHIRRDGVPFANYAQATVLEDGKYVRDVDSLEDGDEVVALDGLNGDDYVYTTIADMLTWDRVLRSGKVLTLEEQMQMYTPQKLASGENAVYDEDEGLGYGFGWATVRDDKYGLIVSHSGGMPGVSTWFERFIDADRTLVFFINREAQDYRSIVGFWKGMRKVAHDETPDPIQSIEELTIQNPDKSKWADYCGHYEKNIEDFPLDEVYMKDGELYAHVVWDEDDTLDCKLYPLEEGVFGRKNGMVRITFGEDCLVIDDVTCKKV